ncbi:hypothetical protein Bca101_083170 [Brassica carinata]
MWNASLLVIRRSWQHRGTGFTHHIIYLATRANGSLSKECSNFLHLPLQDLDRVCEFADGPCDTPDRR